MVKPYYYLVAEEKPVFPAVLITVPKADSSIKFSEQVPNASLFGRRDAS